MKATVMLENTDEPIADIVFQCGFGDVSAFNRILKARIGMSPSQYRDMHRNSQALNDDENLQES
jgi:AraC-like DNA-binding protein